MCFLPITPVFFFFAKKLKKPYNIHGKTDIFNVGRYGTAICSVSHPILTKFRII